ncbi:hypothetical protein Tco_0098637 [Tanacetum coccineum]
MANESTNWSAEPFRSCGKKRTSTDVSESETIMVEMRGGRKASSVEVEMMIEARRKLVEICEEFGTKDVFENDVFGIIIDDLGLGRMKETKLAACCPKMSIADKLEVTKVKVRVIVWKLIRY